MNSVSAIALEQAAASGFGLHISVSTIIVENIDVSRAAKASVFLTAKKQLLCYIHAQSRLTLGDVNKIIARMGLRAEEYLPPIGQPGYFEEYALQKFKDVYPGRAHVSGDDLRYYRTLVAYNPALVIISEVKNGEIYQYDPDARDGWRVSKKFSYRRIPTS